jgi:hypothetical protein
MAEADARDQAYWLAQTPAARLRELERLRQLNYNYGQGKPLPRLQRILRVASLEDLRANKLASGRLKDLADLEVLAKITAKVPRKRAKRRKNKQ